MNTEILKELKVDDEYINANDIIKLLQTIK